MTTTVGGAGGGAFLQTLKAKAERRPSKETPGTKTTSPSQSPSLQRRPSAVLQNGLAMIKKKTSIVGMFSRKPSGESASVETNNTLDRMEDDTVPPVSPIFPGGKEGKAVPSSPIPLLPTSSLAKPMTSQAKSTGSISSIQASPGPAYRKASSNTDVSASPKIGTSRKPSKVQGLSESDHNMRERSLSVTSVESVYGRYNHDSPSFQMENPLMMPNPTSSPKPGNRGVSHTEAAKQQEKRKSLIVSASSHVNQSKLLERRSTRNGHLSVSLSREGMSSGGAPMPYDRQAFSNPEDSFDMDSPLPRPKVIQKPLPLAAPPPSAIQTSRKTSSTSVDSPATSPVRRPTAGSDVGRRPSETFGVPKTSLRTKRANSKLLHDRANYSNNVLSNVPNAAEATALKLRVAELRAFLDKQDVVLSPVNGQDRAVYLLSRYKPEDLTPALFKLFENVPLGWGGFLPMDQRLQWRQKNPTTPQTLANSDSASLERNLKDLMGESTFVANQQIARFQQFQQQNSTSSVKKG